MRNDIYSAKVVIRKSLPTAIAPDESFHVPSPARNAPIGNPDSTAVVPNRAEVLRFAADGKMRWLSLESRPIIDDNGTIAGFMEIENDITERKQAEMKAFAVTPLAEAVNRTSPDYLATMCHEIRNPVNVMIGMMDLALQTNLSAEQLEYLSLMKISSGSLLSIINDSLDLAKIEAGCLQTEKISFSLRDSLGDAMKMLTFEAQRKGLVLAYDVAPDIPDALLGDPMRLRQIVLNLVCNAIKFTGQGDVVMRVERHESADGKIVCCFAISDSGPGIPADRQAAIFEPFVQAEISTSRNYGGSGLGLTISSRLVKAMNGSIWLESTPDKGCTFFFTVPFEEQESPPEIIERIDFKGMRALVIEPHPVSRRFLVNTLGQWNIEAHSAEGGKSAQALVAQARSAQKPYQLLLIDDGLSEMDSAAVIAQLQQNHDIQEGCIVRLCASPRWGSNCIGRKPDGRVCLTMPFKQSELLSVVTAANAVSARPCTHHRRVPARLAPTVAALPPNLHLTILLVDDNPLNCRLAQLVLEKAGCHVVIAGDAATALEIVSSEPPDLVLMDMRMPKMDGTEITMAIREREKTTGGHLPIIALTASVSADDQDYCRQAGMDGYLTKPIATAKLLELIEQLTEAPVSQSESGRQIPRVLDRRALLVSVNGDPQLLGEIVDLFLENSGKLLDRARKMIDAHDQEGFSHVVHTMLGMFKNLCANAAQDAIQNLQELPIDRTYKQTEAIYAQLEKEVGALRTALIYLNDELHFSRRAAKARPQHLIVRKNSLRTRQLLTIPLFLMKAWSLRRIYPASHHLRVFLRNHASHPRSFKS